MNEKTQDHSEIIKHTGRQTAHFWLSAALKSGNQAEISSHLEVLSSAAVNILAQRIMNLQKREAAGDNVMSESEAILRTRDAIEEEIEFLKTQECEFHNLKERK